jgi:hypothetical protein
MYVGVGTRNAPKRSLARAPTFSGFEGLNVWVVADGALYVTTATNYEGLDELPIVEKYAALLSVVTAPRH